MTLKLGWHSAGIPPKELQEMIDEADRDGDGEVNEEEFLRIMKKTNLFWARLMSCRFLCCRAWALNMCAQQANGRAFAMQVYVAT